VNVLVLMYILHRRLGKLGGRKIFISGLRSLACAGIMAGVLLWLLAEMTGDQQTVIPGLPGFGPLLRPSLGLGHFSNLAIVCITVPAGAVVFMLSAWLLRAPELGELLGGMLSKLRKKKTM
jgi:peptidoglycan biosynthesis protein MviN/MurJ (putative lipid II flippase)